MEALNIGGETNSDNLIPGNKLLLKNKIMSPHGNNDGKHVNEAVVPIDA